MSDRVLWFKRGFKDGFPIFLGYLAVSFTLGIAAKRVGMTPFQATLMSVTNYTSAGQFAAIGLIGAGGSYLELAITQLVVNIRYFLMSCALTTKLPTGLPFYHRLFLAGTITDEVFGLSAAAEGRLSPFYSYGAMAFAALGWGGGTLLGIVTGNALPDRLLRAFGVALYGMFIAIIIPKAKESKVFAGIITLSMVASLLFAVLPLLKEISAGFRTILLTVMIAGVAARLFPIEGAKQESEEPTDR
ncbi:MAG: AzlC family ABC transporter permease [Lachnospiraceae bacterium]|jgi:predicted branched-subunit amino acid permease|nr:AzlC family ABC transporter permease [Lachnospiraceae bacterium]